MIYLSEVIVSYIVLKIFLEVIFFLGVIISFIRVVCFARNIYIKDTNIKDTSTRDICVSGLGTIKCSKIHSQSFWILKVEGAK